MTTKTLLTFDIDGTVLNCPGGKLIRDESFLIAFKKYFNRYVSKENLFGKRTIAMTDGQTAELILNRHQGRSSPRDISDLLNFYSEAFNTTYKECPIPTPGIREFLEEINKNPKFVVAFSTGCTKETAEFKVFRAGLGDLFNPFIGGFGDNHLRKLCIREAKRVASIVTNASIGRSFHFGDTVPDIEAALQVNSIPIGLQTGQRALQDERYTKYIYKNLKENKSDILSLLNE